MGSGIFRLIVSPTTRGRSPLLLVVAGVAGVAGVGGVVGVVGGVG
jgi:hypothetical protein